MEEKKLNEQESLELISRMIDQTKKETAIGSGDIFLVWGYLCAVTSLAVFALASVSREGSWGWLYLAIPILGFIISGVVARYLSKKYKNGVKTYQTKSIGSIWGVISLAFAIYAILCICDMGNPAKVYGWTGMFLLGLLLPGIGTYCTGTILKEGLVQSCGGVSLLAGLYFLFELCCGKNTISIEWSLIMAASLFVSLAIPGHILNYKAK